MSATFGLALSGGGAKGLAHIGVLKVLEEVRVPVHLLAGTSMGGVIATMYAAGHSAKTIEEMARSMRLLNILQRDRSGLGLIGPGKIANLLREALGGDPTFDELEIPLALVGTDLETGEEVIMREGSVVEAVLATIAIPFIFPPVEWHGRLLADGGILNQVPFDVVREMGAETDGAQGNARGRDVHGRDVRVIAAYAFRDLCCESEEDTTSERRATETIVRLLIRHSRWGPMIDMVERSQNIMIRKQVAQRMREAPPDLMIEITINSVGLLDLDQLDVCLRAGEEAARRHLPELIALRDAPPPGPLARWWQLVTDRFAEIGRP
jgi:NTE family protein